MEILGNHIKLQEVSLSRMTRYILGLRLRDKFSLYIRLLHATRILLHSFKAPTLTSECLYSNGTPMILPLIFKCVSF